MKIKKCIILLALVSFVFDGWSQTLTRETMLAKIRQVGLQQSEAKKMLQELTDTYGQRLTGSREYLTAAKWMSSQMKGIGLDNVHFENYCADCRGWNIKSFNVEMTSPNYMHLMAYPLAMSSSTNGIVEAELVSIESFQNMNDVRSTFSGKLKGKIILLGKEYIIQSNQGPREERFSDTELETKENQLSPVKKQMPLPELLESWKTSDREDLDFLQFAEKEGAAAIIIGSKNNFGILTISGTYYYLDKDIKPLPYFSITAEHFNRLYRLLKRNVTPTVRLNLETSFYMEPDNNVNIIGEITGSDAKLKSESILIGGHFDSWHMAAGATDNAAGCVALVEALRILKKCNYKPKRTIKIGLWGGEEQAYLGSVAYATKQFNAPTEKPNIESTKVTGYLNLDNGGGAIRGIYLQGNELARPVFKEIFNSIPSLTTGTITIENKFSSDEDTFDHYNIPSFQFIQDELTYHSATHHTNLDFSEYVPESDLKQNAVILAWTIYSILERDSMIPRK